MTKKNIKKVSRYSDFRTDFKTLKIKPNQKYQIDSKIVAYSGHFSSGCVLAILMDENKTKVGRYARFITDFSGKPKTYTIIFTSPSEAKLLKVGIRVNVEYYARSDLEFLLPDENSFEIKEVSADVEDSYDPETGPTILEPLKILNDHEENELEKNLVFILGSTRSGSTWFGFQLLNHKETILWNEPNIALFLGYMKLLRRGSNLENFNKFFSEQHKNIWFPLMRKFILQRTFSQVKTTSKKIVIKEPESKGADFLMECLPNSKMIFLIRDGRDVVDSWIDAHREGSWEPDRKPLLTEEMRIEKIKFYSNYWKALTSATINAYQNHNPDLRLLIRYENLRKDTLSELKKTYEFLDIKTDDSELKQIIDRYRFEKIPFFRRGKGKFHRLAKPGNWKKNFNQQEQEAMNSIMGPSLKEMDYQI